MVEKQPLSDQRIIDCLNTHYDIKVTTLTFLPLGADINASVYKVEAHDQSSYFIKIKRGHHHDISATIIALLHDTDGQNRIESYNHFIAQFEPKGVVDIAFKTGEGRNNER